jgi:hypothetical protein
MALPDPRLRIPPTKTSGQPMPQQNVNTPKAPMNPNISPIATPTSATQQMQPQQVPQMKKGGTVKCMKAGGVVSADMKKSGRNVARAANQKSGKSVKVGSTPVVKGGGVIGKTKRGYGAARRG